ncbi:MAG: 5'/3'-nucleotidase SurE [Anaerolineae bacterium]|nr:5'/3'-nucleotidase SurE [Anaerolineae bacterium]
MQSERPLILVSNDDGIMSPGLEALVRALHRLGNVMVVAPRSPYSSAGRSFAGGTRDIQRWPWPVPGVTAYAVDAAPALTVRVALEILVPRCPDLMASGINQGENVGSDVTISGTVGAAIEAAVSSVPALAFSLEAPVEYHDTPKPGLDFRAAAAFAALLARAVLAGGLPAGVDLLKVDVPADAGPGTPWALTRISRHRYWHPIVTEKPDGDKEIVGYARREDCHLLEPDSDVYALVCRRAISVSPMTVDLTAACEGQRLQGLLPLYPLQNAPSAL